MFTKIIQLDPQNFSIEKLQEAANLIKNNDIVAFPTETVYGLGGSVYSETAIKKIYKAKGRPIDNPLIVHISNLDQLKELVNVFPEKIKQLCETYWPGPLTILFHKSKNVPDLVTAGLSTVAIRMPSHPIALALINAVGNPIAAPSANRSGKPSPTTADHVIQDMNGRIPLILDGGMSNVGIESTVIDVNCHPPMILRPGGLNLEKLRQILPNIEVYNQKFPDKILEDHPSTPGLKYRHYSPRAEVILIEGNVIFIQKTIQELFNQNQSIRKSIGIIHTHKSLQFSMELQKDPKIIIYNLGVSSQKQNNVLELDPANIAKGLFAALRSLDSQNVDIIIVEGIPEEKEGLAVMNRLRKAALKIMKEKEKK